MILPDSSGYINFRLTKPVLNFPVLGHDNRDVASCFRINCYRITFTSPGFLSAYILELLGVGVFSRVKSVGFCRCIDVPLLLFHLSPVMFTSITSYPKTSWICYPSCIDSVVCFHGLTVFGCYSIFFIHTGNQFHPVGHLVRLLVTL